MSYHTLSPETSGEASVAELQAFADSHEHGLICHLDAWRKVIESSFPHIRCHRIVGRNEMGAIQSALPLYHIRSRLLGDRLVSTPFATLSDPLVGSAGELSSLLDEALDMERRLKCGSTEIRVLNTGPLFKHPGFRRRSEFKLHYLELDRDPEKTWSTFHRSAVQKNIRRAQGSGACVRIADGKKDLRTFFSLYASTRHRLGLPCQPFEFFCNIQQSLGPDGRVRLLLLEHEGATLAGLMLFAYKNRVSAAFRSSSARVGSVELATSVKARSCLKTMNPPGAKDWCAFGTSPTPCNYERWS